MISGFNNMHSSYSQINQKKGKNNFYNPSFKAMIRFNNSKIASDIQKSELDALIQQLSTNNIITGNKFDEKYNYVQFSRDNIKKLSSLIDFFNNLRMDVQFSSGNFETNNPIFKQPEKFFKKRRDTLEQNVNDVKFIDDTNIAGKKGISELNSKIMLYENFMNNASLDENNICLSDVQKKIVKFLLVDKWEPNREVIDLTQAEISKGIDVAYPHISKNIKILQDMNLLESFQNGNKYRYRFSSRFFQIATGSNKFNTGRFEISVNKLKSDELEKLKLIIQDSKNKGYISNIIEEDGKIKLEFDNNKVFINEYAFELKKLMESVSKLNLPAAFYTSYRNLNSTKCFPQGILIKINPDNELSGLKNLLSFPESPINQILDSPEFVQKYQLNYSDQITLKHIVMCSTDKPKEATGRLISMKYGFSNLLVLKTLTKLQEYKFITLKSPFKLTPEFFEKFGIKNSVDAMKMIEDGSTAVQSIKISV
jgi:hypothetical protein